ncbi:hypothetical protein ABW21_db0204743 [Orbilia brochopaga]|nr:hypothetical protein ABW21_db0204743 [Drechslerella brochopaga]
MATLAGTRSSPQTRASSPPWFENYPPIDPQDNRVQRWPPLMLEFIDPEIHRLVFLPKISRRALEPADLRFNERAAFLGESLLTALVSDFLYTEFIEYAARDLTAMRQALLAPTVLSNLCQRVNLIAHIQNSPPDRLPDEHALAKTFQSYIGGIYHDRGVEGYPVLRNWFYVLIKPYAMICKSNYDQYAESLRAARRDLDPRFTEFAASSNRPGGYALNDPIPRSGTVPPSMQTYWSTSGPSSSHSSRHVSRGEGTGHVKESYVKELKEYCEKYHLPTPAYTEQDNGNTGDYIRWRSTVFLNGKFWGKSPEWATTKRDAKATASKVALNNLRYGTGPPLD